MTLDELIASAISRPPESQEVARAAARLTLSAAEVCDLVARTVAERR